MDFVSYSEEKEEEGMEDGVNGLHDTGWVRVCVCARAWTREEEGGGRGGGGA